MGNCILGYMDKKGEENQVEYPFYKKRITYGEANYKMTEDLADRSGIYRCSKQTDEMHKQYSEIYYGKNVLQQIKDKCLANGSKSAIAYRKIKKTFTKKIKDEKTGKMKDWQMLEMSDIHYISFSTFWSNIIAFGKGLMELGIQPGSKVGVYEDTRWEWITSVLGMWMQHITAATVYANLGYDGLLYALGETKCKAVVCNGSSVKKLIEMMKNTSVEEFIIIYLDELPADIEPSNYQLVSWNSVLERGKQSKLPEPEPTSDPDEPLLIMYTSGTVGEPKGVIHSLGALTQGKQALVDRLKEMIGLNEGETYISYLPAAHIFEFICEMIFLTSGVLLCFGSPRTLTDVSTLPKGDLTTYNPFFLIGVPRIFETIKKAVEAKLPPPGSLKRDIFELAYTRRRDALQRGMDTPYWNEKVFKLPRKMVGTSLRGFCSGGAPLADHTQEWVNVVLGVPVAQGYGLTESVCNGCVQRIGELSCVAGQLLRGVEMRLLDTEQYKHTDQPYPRGEALLRGKFIFKGYYNQEETTKQAMLPDGWFRTGDVVEIRPPDNHVHVIGRVKALAKNQLGEYIALEQMEAIYCQHPAAMPNGVCVIVDPHSPFIAALMLTEESKAMSFAKSKNIPGEWPSIIKSKAFLEELLTSMQEIALAANRKSFEFIKKIRVYTDEWTPENGLTTASMKLRRPQIDERYKKDIEELFRKEA